MKIMLDGGHGYNTPGKRTPDGMREFEFNSAVANYAKTMLEQYKDTTVYMAHDPSGKIDIPLKTRTDRANQLNVDAYVSIHANGFGSGGWNDVGGIETFIHPSRPPIAYQLAQKIQRNLVACTGLVDRGVKTADFHVLRETEMNAVLAECGFMTNQREAALLKTDAYRRMCADAIVKGLVDQYKLVKKPAPQPVVRAAATTTAKTATTATTSAVYRLIVDGKQVIALSNYDSMANEVKKYLGKARDIQIQKV